MDSINAAAVQEAFQRINKAFDFLSREVEEATSQGVTDEHISTGVRRSLNGKEGSQYGAWNKLVDSLHKVAV